MQALTDFVAAADLSSLEAFCAAYPAPALTLRFPDPGAAQPDLSQTADEESMAALLGDPMQRTHLAFL
ncbi:MAG: hypothetical protein KDD82_09780, partial [Planctomycetes bacterium]|nr:hypothetical protein [Planctomycetota bacterium]